MVGIVGVFAQRVGKGYHAGDRPARGAKDPAGDQLKKYPGAGNCEDRKKLLQKFRPCRKDSIHIDLRVFFLDPLKTSVGRYVFDDKPLKAVA